jgi:polyhydroxybutyrate depolymerase
MKSLFYLFLLSPLALTAQEIQGHLTWDGLNRTFLVYLPKDEPQGVKLPVIFALHGRFGTPEGTVKLADFRPIADREKVILVYPAGISHSWNDGRLKTPAHKKNIDDVGFLNQLMTYMIRNYPVDSTRIYVTGMSNGGFMTSRLGCALSNRVAAIAVVAASIGEDSACQPERPVSVLYMQGTKDPLVPCYGGEMELGAGGMIDSHRQVLDRWIAIDGCANRPVVRHWPDSAGDGTTITREEYVNTASGARVVGYTIEGGGHAWPGGWAYLPKLFIGVTSKNLNACEAIWAFFESVPNRRQ